MTPNPNPSPELKACPNPWCNGRRADRPTPFVRYYESACYYRVNCDVCPQIGPSGDTEAEAIVAWNTRALTPPTPAETVTVALPGAGEVERLRAALKPFADACNFTTADDSESLYDTLAAEKLTWRDLRNARAALGEKAC